MCNCLSETRPVPPKDGNAVREPQVQLEINRLYNSVEKLEYRINDMASSLLPVLRGPTPEETNKVCRDACNLVPIAIELFNIEDRIALVSKTIEDLNSRLEV